jgi:hypothetical protein
MSSSFEALTSRARTASSLNLLIGPSSAVFASKALSAATHVTANLIFFRSMR